MEAEQQVAYLDMQENCVKIPLKSLGPITIKRPYTQIPQSVSIHSFDLHSYAFTKVSRLNVSFNCFFDGHLYNQY